MPSTIRAALAAVLAATAVQAQTATALPDDIYGCRTDNECKGDRICVQHECVSPQATPPAQSAPRSQPAQATAARTVQHHRGFFFRPDLGLGYLRMATSNGGNEVSLHGGAASLGLAIGGSVAPNHVLAFHLWDAATSNPTLSTNGQSSSFGRDTTAGVVCVGPEYTWYSPTNFYISISPGVSVLNLDTGGTSYNSSAGFGLRLALGKEWWVSDNWGLGVQGQLTFSTNRDGDAGSPVWTTWGGTIAFSATYN